MDERTASPSVPLYPGFCPKVREPRWMSLPPQSSSNATAADFIRAMSASAQTIMSGDLTQRLPRQMGSDPLAGCEFAAL